MRKNMNEYSKTHVPVFHPNVHSHFAVLLLSAQLAYVNYEFTVRTTERRGFYCETS